MIELFLLVIFFMNRLLLWSVIIWVLFGEVVEVLIIVVVRIKLVKMIFVSVVRR